MTMGIKKTTKEAAKAVQRAVKTVANHAPTQRVVEAAATAAAATAAAIVVERVLRKK